MELTVAQHTPPTPRKLDFFDQDQRKASIKATTTTPQEPQTRHQRAATSAIVSPLDRVRAATLAKAHRRGVTFSRRAIGRGAGKSTPCCALSLCTNRLLSFRTLLSRLQQSKQRPRPLQVMFNTFPTRLSLDCFPPPFALSASTPPGVFDIALLNTRDDAHPNQNVVS